MVCKVCGYEENPTATGYRYIFTKEPLTNQTLGVVLFEQGKPAKFVTKFIFHQKSLIIHLPDGITHIIYGGFGSQYDLNFILLTEAQAQKLPDIFCEKCFEKILADETVSIAPYMNTDEDGNDDPEVQQIIIGKYPDLTDES